MRPWRWSFGLTARPTPSGETEGGSSMVSWTATWRIHFLDVGISKGDRMEGVLSLSSIQDSMCRASARYTSLSPLELERIKSQKGLDVAAQDSSDIVLFLIVFWVCASRVDDGVTRCSDCPETDDLISMLPSSRFESSSSSKNECRKRPEQENGFVGDYGHRLGHVICLSW